MALLGMSLLGLVLRRDRSMHVSATPNRQTIKFNVHECDADHRELRRRGAITSLIDQLCSDSRMGRGKAYPGKLKEKWSKLKEKRS